MQKVHQGGSPGLPCAHAVEILAGAPADGRRRRKRGERGIQENPDRWRHTIFAGGESMVLKHNALAMAIAAVCLGTSAGAYAATAPSAGQQQSAPERTTTS